LSKHVKKADSCPNCDHKLHGENFCPNCGQKNDIRRIRFRHFIAESLSNFFAVDGRFMHTLAVLFSKPGKVPKNYIHGKRQRYVHPVRIYFLASILLLFVIQYSGGSDDIVKVDESESAEEPNDVVSNLSDAQDSLLLEFAEEEPEEASEYEDQKGRITKMMDYYSATSETDALIALDAIKLENNLWNRFLYTQSIKITEFDDKEFSRYFASKLFWVLFLYLPILAGLYHLFYLRRKFYYPEHLFFTFYNQSVFFLILTLGLLLSYLTQREGIVLVFALSFIIIYQYLALRRFYGQGVGKTILKFILINLLTIPLFGLFFILAALITFIFF
jgi:hypothetical protein